MKFVKKAAVLAAALIAVQYLPGFVTNHFADAETANTQDAEIVDAMITGYEGDADDPETFKVITAAQTASQQVSTDSKSAGLIHNSKFDNYSKIDGIDVSKYNGDINWNAVKADGIDYAIVRIGYRGYDGGLLVTDPYYYQNMQGAINAGIKVGAYFFTQAITVQEAIDEAKLCIARVKDYDIKMPIYFDVELTEGNGKNGRLNTSGLSIKQRTAIAEAFCQTIQDAGYEAGIYSSKSYFLDYLDPDYLSTKYKIWLANYTNQTSYKGDYQMWQYSSTGSVEGISGNVDMNVFYSEKVNFTDANLTITDASVPVKPEVTGNGNLTFESSDPSVATVDAAGNISGISSGTSVITVFSDNGSRDTITVTVDFPPAAVLNYTGMLFSKIGESEVISPSGVQLISSDSGVVSVSEDGTIVATGCGTAAITASDGKGNTAICNILVTDSEPLSGDCNLDGVVNAVDAVYILNLASVLGVDGDEAQFSDSYMKLYDFNNDGKVDSFDASDVLIKSAYAGVGYNK